MRGGPIRRGLDRLSGPSGYAHQRREMSGRGGSNGNTASVGSSRGGSVGNIGSNRGGSGMVASNKMYNVVNMYK